MTLRDDQLDRYARHIVLKEIGGEGQRRLLAARIVVDDGQSSDPGCREILNHRRSDSSGPDDRDMSGEQPALPFAAYLLEDDVAGIAVELGVAEDHRPVEPKPPSPRAVASRSSTSSKRAWRTGAGTSWAMRSPRRTSNGSAPRLARITFTSPR